MTIIWEGSCIDFDRETKVTLKAGDGCMEPIVGRPGEGIRGVGMGGEGAGTMRGTRDSVFGITGKSNPSGVRHVFAEGDSERDRA
jgi:hypothetical protein